MLRCYGVTVSAHDPASFPENGLGGTVLHEVTRFFYEVILHQTADLHTCRRFVRQREASLGIFNGELLWQIVEGIDGLLLTMGID